MFLLSTLVLSFEGCDYQFQKQKQIWSLRTSSKFMVLEPRVKGVLELQRLGTSEC